MSALLHLPPAARACYVLAHGAGAGMQHPFMSAAAAELGALGIATLRYQFPYMERRSRRPDPPALCHATVRAATLEAARRYGRVVSGGSHGCSVLIFGRHERDVRREDIAGRKPLLDSKCDGIAFRREIIFCGSKDSPIGLVLLTCHRKHGARGRDKSE